MIKIKQYKDDWRLEVEEEFEFENEKDFEEALKTFLRMKKQFGKLKDFNKNRY
jgi:hypothetical protein